MYTERLDDRRTSNLIIYDAGPINISISGWSEEIIISSSNKKWDYLIPEILSIAKEAWEINDDDLKSVNRNKVVIRLNYKILKLYIEHNIIFY